MLNGFWFSAVGFCVFLFGFFLINEEMKTAPGATWPFPLPVLVGLGCMGLGAALLCHGLELFIRKWSDA